MRIRIQPYGISKSAKTLANSLNDLGTLGTVMRLAKAGRSRFVARPDDIIINWGSSEQRFNLSQYINCPVSVRMSANKLHTFNTLEGRVSLPAFTADKGIALSWLHNGNAVYARTSLSGHSGNGIVIMRSPDDIIEAPLYTKQVHAEDEYRIHVCKVADDDYIVFDQQQKKRKNGVESSYEIRNHSNGWVFAREGLCVPERVQVEAINAIKALGLDFGGVDVAYSQEARQAYVYEVNTACGLEGSTVTSYTDMLYKMIQRRIGDA